MEFIVQPCLLQIFSRFPHCELGMEDKLRKFNTITQWYLKIWKLYKLQQSNGKCTTPRDFVYGRSNTVRSGEFSQSVAEHYLFLNKIKLV